ncbi:MAG: tyrosine-type recombinase/integrase [Coriobacteriales bacterium]
MKRYSLGAIRRHGSQWQAVLTVTDETGTKKQKTKLLGIECDKRQGKGRGNRDTQSGKGAARAKAALAEWREQLIAQDEAHDAEDAEQAEAKSRSAAQLTVSEYVSRFIEQRGASSVIEPSTVIDYEGSLNNLISIECPSAIGNIPVADLRPEDVRSWETYLVTPKPKGAGYSNNTAAKGHRLLKQAMNQAVNDGTIDKDPTRGIKPPKREKSKPNALDTKTAPQMVKFLDSMPCETCVTIAARLALFTGMRRGEVCGLRWGDVDLDKRTAWVKRSVGVGEGGTYVKAPKTGKVRDVPLPKSLVSPLRKWKAKQSEECLALGITDMSSQYVIGTPDAYRNPTNLGKAWTQLAKLAGIRGTEGRIPTFHDLRHSFATLAIAGGMDVKTVSSILGHANAAMTLNIYASPDPEAKRNGASLIDSILEPRQGETVPLTGTEGR